MTTCPSCHTDVPERTRFCPECGTKIPPLEAGSGVSVSGEAMVSGDIIGSKSETRVAGNYTNNVTNVTNQDATKAVHTCAISGKQVTFSDLRSCPQCQQKVSSEYYDLQGMRCFTCKDKALAELKSAFEDRLGNDGIINSKETRELIELQTRLKINQKGYQEIETLVRENYLAKVRQDSAAGKTAIPGIGKKIEAAKKAVSTNQSQIALKLLKPTWEECRDNREYRNVFLNTLLVTNPAELVRELEHFKHEELSIDLLRIKVLLALGEPEAASKFLIGNALKNRAYATETDWSLLESEIAIDQALTADEEFLRHTYLEAANESLAPILEEMEPESNSALRFFQELLESLNSSRGDRSKAYSVIQRMIQEASEAEDQSAWFPFMVLAVSKVKLLESLGVRAAASVEKTQPSVGGKETSADSKKCANCGNPMPASARFCGSCGETVAAVTLFLEKIGMQQYADLFSNNRIDESIIAELTENDLKNIGITSIGHRKKIFGSIQVHNW